MDIVNILIAVAVIAGGVATGYFEASTELITSGIIIVSGVVLFFKELFAKKK
jgi:hypothetical protein